MTQMPVLLSKVNRFFSLIWKSLVKFQQTIMIICSILIILGISAQAAFRYLLQLDFYGLDEFIVIIAFWLYFMGSSYGSYEQSHIKADIVSVYIKNQKIKDFLKLIASSITTGISLLVTYWALDFFIWGIVKQAKSPVLSIPMVIPQSAIFIGFILMSLYSVVYLYLDIKKFFSGDPITSNQKRGSF
ncbi:MAG: hypothetical protein APF76_10180 [Desulfitibacter sp. BRH_c19]|nr:MAG: hypothetical protein APF76_10180 [Desulfitibacter sp. BRH_c19]